MLYAKRPQKLSFLLAAGCRKNLRVELLRDLNRSQAYSPGSGMNQYPLARLQLRQSHQSVVGSQERDRNRTRFVVVNRLWLGHQRVLGRSRVPLLSPSDAEREGYVPNVVYTCGAMAHAGRLFIPYGIADSAVGFASVEIEDLLASLG